MNDYEYLAKTINEQLESGSPVVLVSIINAEGSSPRHIGTKMVVGVKDNYGTIGGSLIEATAISESRLALDRKQSATMNFDLTADDPATDGMNCGGTAELLLDFISPSRESMAFFRQNYDLARKSNDFYLLTVLADSNPVNVAGHSLVLPDGTSTGTYSWTEGEFAEVKSELHDISSTTVLSLKGNRVIIDPVRRTKTVYCFGAGHVALPTAHLAALVGFQVVVLDDRANFANAPEISRSL